MAEKKQSEKTVAEEPKAEAKKEPKLNGLLKMVKNLEAQLRQEMKYRKEHTANWKRFAKTHFGSESDGTCGRGSIQMLVFAFAFVLLTSLAAFGLNILTWYDGDSVYGTIHFRAGGGVCTMTVDKVVCDNLIVSEDISVQDVILNDLTVAGLATVAETLGVTGVATFTATPVCLNGLTVGTNATVGGTLGVTGVATFTATPVCLDGLTVGTNATVGGTLVVTGNLTAGNLSTTTDSVTGNFYIATNLTVTGTVASVGVLTCTAESVHNGGLDTKYVTVDAEAGVDVKSAGGLALGTNIATSVIIAKTAVNTDILGTLSVDEVATFDAESVHSLGIDAMYITVDPTDIGLDAKTAGTLAIGTNIANAIDIGKTTEITTIKGLLNVDEVASFDVSPTVLTRYALLSKDGTTQYTTEHGTCTNSEEITFTTVFSAVPQIFLTYQEDAGADTLAEASSVDATNFTCIAVNSKSVAWMAIGAK